MLQDDDPTLPGLSSRPHTVFVQAAQEKKVGNTKQVITLGDPAPVHCQLTPGNPGDYYDAHGEGAALSAPHLLACNLEDASLFAYGYRVTDARGRAFAVRALPQIWDAGESTDSALIVLDYLEFG